MMEQLSLINKAIQGPAPSYSKRYARPFFFRRPRRNRGAFFFFPGLGGGSPPRWRSARSVLDSSPSVGLPSSPRSTADPSHKPTSASRCPPRPSDRGEHGVLPTSPRYHRSDAGCAWVSSSTAADRRVPSGTSTGCASATPSACAARQLARGGPGAPERARLVKRAPTSRADGPGRLREAADEEHYKNGVAAVRHAGESPSAAAAARSPGRQPLDAERIQGSSGCRSSSSATVTLDPEQTLDAACCCQRHLGPVPLRRPRPRGGRRSADHPRRERRGRAVRARRGAPRRQEVQRAALHVLPDPGHAQLLRHLLPPGSRGRRRRSRSNAGARKMSPLPRPAPMASPPGRAAAEIVELRKKRPSQAAAREHQSAGGATPRAPAAAWAPPPR